MTELLVLGLTLVFRIIEGPADINYGEGLIMSFALTGHRVIFHISQTSVSFRLFCQLSLLYTSCAFCYCGITMQSFHCMAT